MSVANWYSTCHVPPPIGRASQSPSPRTQPNPKGGKPWTANDTRNTLVTRSNLANHFLPRLLLLSFSSPNREGRGDGRGDREQGAGKTQAEFICAYPPAYRINSQGWQTDTTALLLLLLLPLRLRARGKSHDPDDGVRRMYMPSLFFRQYWPCRACLRVR